MKKVWLINPYAYPPEYETRLRTIKTAQYLIESGYDVTIFGGSFVHNTETNLIVDKRKYDIKEYGNLKFVHIKNCNYSSTLGRFRSLRQFYSRLKKLVKKFARPDIIINDLCLPFGAKIYKAARKLDAVYIGQVQDLWPESFVCFGLIKRKGLIHRILRRNEFKSYLICDAVIFSMEGYWDYIVDQGWQDRLDPDKLYYLNNGVDLTDFCSHKEQYILEDEDLKSQSIFRIIYMGSIRLANDIDKIIDAAKLIKDERIKILIFGDGDQRQTLEERCQDEGINNVIFKQKRIPIEYVPYVLSQGDLSILNYMPNDIWKYGGSQSKMFQYLAAGKPILSNLKIGYSIIDRFGCGTARKFGSGAEYASAIECYAQMQEAEYRELCSNALEASKQFDYRVLIDKLIVIMDEVSER